MADRLDTARLERFIANPRRAIWNVSAPIIAGMLLHVAYNVADTAFVGRLGPTALAGLTIVFPLFFVLVALATGIGSGITVLVAQAIGRQDREAAERAGGTAISLGLIVGALLTTGGLTLGPTLLRHLGAEGPVVNAAWDYFFVIACAAPVPMCGALLRALLVGQGDTRTPMYVMLFATVLNIGLDPLFIFTLGWGIRGAALATALAQILSALVLLYLVLTSRRSVLHIRPCHLLPRWRAIRAVLSFGVPASLSQLTMALGALLMNRVVATFGESALAGYGIGSRVDSIVAMPILGLASGAVTVVGMFAGAARADLVRTTTAYVLRWALGMATAVGLTMFATRDLVLGLFSSDAATVAVGRYYLLFMVFVYPLMGIGITGSRLLLGLGYPNLSLLLTCVRLLVIAVPVAYISVFLLGAPIDLVWWGILSGAGASNVLGLTLVYQLVWQRDPTRRATA